MTKTLIIGLGNPILGDDGVGWKVAQEVERQLPPLSMGEAMGARESLSNASPWLESR